MKSFSGEGFQGKKKLINSLKYWERNLERIPYGPQDNKSLYKRLHLVG